MKLKKWNHDLGASGGFEQAEHPDHIIKPFMEFVLFNQQWPEQLELMYRRVHVLRRDLTDWRNERALETAACTAITKSGEPCHVANDIKDGLCHIHRRALVAA